MILSNLLITVLVLLSIHLTKSSESNTTCIPDGEDCFHGCDCCGEKTGSICIQRASDNGPKCYKSTCNQLGHSCSSDIECCSQSCDGDQCVWTGSKLQWTLVDLITTQNDICSSDIKAILNLNLTESDNDIDLSKYDESQDRSLKFAHIHTDVSIASIIVKSSNSGRLKYLVLQTNNSTSCSNEDNDPTSFQMFAQCSAESPLEQITTERRTNLPVDRGFEKWYRIAGNNDCEYYLLVFKNSKGNPMDFNFQLKAKQQTIRANEQTSSVRKLMSVLHDEKLNSE